MRTIFACRPDVSLYQPAFLGILLLATSCGGLGASHEDETAAHSVQSGNSSAKSWRPDSQARPIKPGLVPDFAPVEQLVVVWDEDLLQFEADMLLGAWGSAKLVVVHHPEDDPSSLFALIDAEGRDSTQVERVPLEVETPWVRDYGPLVVRRPDGATELIDFRYEGGEVDDAAAYGLGVLFYPDTNIVTLDFELDGGNLLSDGEGRCISTDAVLNDNMITADEGRSIAAEWLGCREMFFVPRLVDEPTQHVDMFVHLPGPHTAMVGRYDPAEDPINAVVLDRTAAILQRAGFDVRRVPMPSHEDGNWRSYLNATVVNDVVLIPAYRDDWAGESEAMAAFDWAYPGRRIRRIDASWVIQREGAVHCTTLTQPRLY